MRKTLATLATAAALSVAVVALPQPTLAAPHGHGWHHGWHGGGIIGGLAAGAIIGGMLSGPGYYGYYGGPYYGGYYGYGGPYAYGECWRQRVWTHHGWRWQRFCR